MLPEQLQIYVYTSAQSSRMCHRPYPETYEEERFSSGWNYEHTPTKPVQENKSSCVQYIKTLHKKSRIEKLPEPQDVFHA